MDWKLVGGIGLVGLGLLGLNRQSKRAESFEATQWWNRQSATGHENPSGDYGGFFISIPHHDLGQIKEIFKDWKPKAYPYEKRITQDSFTNYCEDCGEIHDEEKLIHYQFYLPQSNSRHHRMRYVSGDYCSNGADCGADMCESCHDNGNKCEECSNIICNTCKEDSEYTTGDILCQECMPEEYQAESFSADCGTGYVDDGTRFSYLFKGCGEPNADNERKVEGNKIIYCQGCIDGQDSIDYTSLEGDRNAESFSAGDWMKKREEAHASVIKRLNSNKDLFSIKVMKRWGDGTTTVLFADIPTIVSLVADEWAEDERNTEVSDEELAHKIHEEIDYQPQHLSWDGTGKDVENWHLDLAEPEWAEDERNKANAESFSAEPAWLKEGKIHGDSTCMVCDTDGPEGEMLYGRTIVDTGIHPLIWTSLICKSCAGEKSMDAESFSAEGDNQDLLKWIEDYLWDNDKKGYQAYYEHRKSLGLSAENNAYTYAYNEGHSDARKTGKYHPTLVADRDKADFKRVLKQKE